MLIPSVVIVSCFGTMGSDIILVTTSGSLPDCSRNPPYCLHQNSILETPVSVLLWSQRVTPFTGTIQSILVLLHFVSEVFLSLKPRSGHHETSEKKCEDWTSKSNKVWSSVYWTYPFTEVASSWQSAWGWKKSFTVKEYQYFGYWRIYVIHQTDNHPYMILGLLFKLEEMFP